MKAEKSVPPNVVQSLRQQRNLSRLSVSKLLNISYPVLYALESGKRCSLSTACKVADFFQISLQTLLDNDIPRALREANDDKPAQSSNLLSLLNNREIEPDAISGIEFCRLKARMSQKTLAKLSDIHVVTIGNLERGGLSGRVYTDEVQRITDALRVSADELLRAHHRDELEPGDRCPWPADGSTGNLLDNYRVFNNLSYQQMGTHLGITRQWAYTICHQRYPEKYVRLLCEIEGISLHAFLIQYGTACHTTEQFNRPEEAEISSCK